MSLDYFLEENGFEGNDLTEDTTKDYWCGHCNRSFYEEEVFFDHAYDYEENIPLGERPWPYCPICGSALE
jgi:hypothetical protein